MQNFELAARSMIACVKFILSEPSGVESALLRMT